MLTESVSFCLKICACTRLTESFCPCLSMWTQRALTALTKMRGVPNPEVFVGQHANPQVALGDPLLTALR